MSDTLIQDNVLKGSPILSYGQSGPKRVWSGLFGLIAAIVGGLIILLGILFWFFTKIPVPKNTVLMAILPASTQLPSSAPDIWLEAVSQNKILPVIVGFVAVSGEDPEPFALKTPNLFDLNFLKTGRWSLIARTSNFPPGQSPLGGGQLPTSESLKSPAALFGLSFWRKNVLLTINLKNLLSGPGAEFKDLPEILSGPVEGNIWRTGMKSDERFSLSREDYGSGGFALIKPEASSLIKNALASQGTVLDLSGEGILSWNSSSTSSDYEFVGSAENSFEFTLPDSRIANSAAPATPERSNGGREQRACQGKILAVFDQPAIENICSWLGFCFVRPQELVVAEQNATINFCYSGL